MLLLDTHALLWLDSGAAMTRASIWIRFPPPALCTVTFRSPVTLAICWIAARCSAGIASTSAPPRPGTPDQPRAIPLDAAAKKGGSLFPD
jgi:hypothetical protein